MKEETDPSIVTLGEIAENLTPDIVGQNITIEELIRVLCGLHPKVNDPSSPTAFNPGLQTMNSQSSSKTSAANKKRTEASLKLAEKKHEKLVKGLENTMEIKTVSLP